MKTIRDIKTRARRDLHANMGIAAYYIPDPSDLTTYTEVKVRVHTSFAALGLGFGGAYAESAEVLPRVVFLRSEVPAPKSNAIVSVAAGEAYQIVQVNKPDGITVTAEATVANISGAPYPEA